MKCCKLPYLFFILAGVLLGYLAAMGNFSPDKTVDAAVNSGAIGQSNLTNFTANGESPANLTLPATGQIQHQHMTNDEFESFVSTKKAESDSSNGQQAKPNIVIIMGDDIGWFNIGCYHRGMMSGKTPNIDKLAREGMMFTDYYAEASCTAGRANFITGMLPYRTGMTTVGQAGSPLGLPAERSDDRHRAEGYGLRHGPIRQEPPGRLESVSPDSPRL